MVKSIKSSSEVKKHYIKKGVVKNYIESRFDTPLGFVLHKNHVNEVNKLIEKQKIDKVLEIACGPARITTEICGIKKGFAIDSSSQMLREARKRMKRDSKEFNNWKLELLDANNLSKRFVSSDFDFVFTFRFLRHFNKADRRNFILEIKKVLKKDGFLMFDAPNRRVESLVRKVVGSKKYNVYDYLWDESDLEKELKTLGFYNIVLIPNIRHFWIEGIFSKLSSWVGMKQLFVTCVFFLERIGSTRNPYEWIVICQKK